MKKNILGLLALNLILGLFLAQRAMASELVVNQEFTIKYYDTGILFYHTRTVEEVLNQEVRKYSCLQGILDYKITKKNVTSIFGSDTPGDVKINYQTKCFDSNLIALNLSIDSFGYDEDYTVVDLKFTTKTGINLKKFCVYGMDAEVRNCPKN